MDGPRRVRTNGIELAVWTAGPEEGPAVVLLHGFPECAHGWARQVPALARAGFRCVVPDLRGYGASDRPLRVRDYAVDVLVADVLGLMDAEGRRRFHVVAHDWGGILGWHLALDHADRVASFAALNIPHPEVMWRKVWSSPAQARRSWYILAFQVPGLAERLLTPDRLTRALLSSAGDRPFTPEDLAVYRGAWTRPGAVRAMVSWYRAALRHRRRPRGARVARPTRIVWGQADTALGWEMATESAARCDDVTLHLLPGVGHFVQHNAAAEVTRLLLEFLESHRGEPGCGPAGDIR